MSRWASLRTLARWFERRTSHTAPIVEKDGLRFYADPQGLVRETFEPFEPAVRHYLKTTLKRGMVFLDVGAHVGWYSLLAAQLGVAQVHAFEPSPITYGTLVANTRLNHTTSIETHNVALSDHDGTETLFMIGNAWGWTSLDDPRKDLEHRVTRNFARGENQTVYDHQVDVRTLDSYDLPRVDLVKIDVEGLTDAVIAGGIETIRRCRPAIIAEYPSLETAERLQALGYQRHELGPENSLFEPVSV